MKRKSLATLLSGFLTVCLTGVGFAAWVITGDGSASIDDGTVNVETVSDQRVKIRKCTAEELVTITDEDFNIKFGHEADAGVTNPWFKWDETDGITADKTANIPFYIENHSHATVKVEFDAALVKLTGAETESDESDDYITLSYNYVAPEDSTSDAEQLAYIEISYAWGAAFDGKNPYTYYNGLTCDEDLVEEIFDLFGTTGKLRITTFSIKIIGEYHD